MIDKVAIRVLTTHAADFDLDLNSFICARAQRPVVAIHLALYSRMNAGALCCVRLGYGRWSVVSIVSAVKLSGSRLSMPWAM